MTLDRIRLATNDLSERDRVPFMRDFYGRAIMGLDIAPLTDAAFDMEMNVALLDQVGIASGRVSPIQANRTKSLVRDGNDNILIGYYTAGFLHSDLRNGGILVGKRDIIAMPLDQPYDWTFAGPGTTTAIHLNRKALAALIPKYDLDDISLLHSGRGVVDLLFPYADTVLNTSDIAGAAATLASKQILELAALILSEARHPDEIGASGSLRAARLAAIRRDLSMNFHNQGLSVNDMAIRHGVSVRYIQMLFEQDGMTFTKYLQKTRLDFAYARLVNAPDSVRVLDIAVEAGFTDLSTFNRLFRKQFGDTPSSLRVYVRQLSDTA